ncbi:MAG: NAD-dependent epimerase/dehydratase family protein [Anaerolineales bacterium]
MRIAITGGSGGIGRVVIELALAHGHSAVNIDRAAPPVAQPGVPFVLTDITNYDEVERALRGCDALIHLAAIPSPGNHPDPVVHHNNVMGSYNALRAAAEVGITRVCQASSVNALGLSYSRAAHFDYFPLDEQHPTYNEEPYGLSKWICEMQADSIARRYEHMVIASLRFHWVVERAMAAEVFEPRPETAKQLWAYTRPEAAARACLLGVTADFKGHEVFYIVAPDTVTDTPSLELAQRFFPHVPVRGDLSGNRSFFDSSKAERVLGWRHEQV